MEFPLSQQSMILLASPAAEGNGGYLLYKSYQKLRSRSKIEQLHDDVMHNGLPATAGFLSPVPRVIIAGACGLRFLDPGAK